MQDLDNGLEPDRNSQVVGASEEGRLIGRSRQGFEPRDTLIGESLYMTSLTSFALGPFQASGFRAVQAGLNSTRHRDRPQRYEWVMVAPSSVVRTRRTGTALSRYVRVLADDDRLG